MADDPLQQAAENLEKAARGLIDLPELLQSAWAQNAAQRALDQMQAPQGQNALVWRAELESRGALQQSQANLARQEARERQLATPQGQAQAQQQAGAASQLTASQLRADTLRAQAELARLRTPQGRAEQATQRQAQRQNAQARAQLQAEQNPASGMDRFRAAMDAAARGVQAFRSALSQAEGVALQLASRGSPTHVATFQGSQDLLMARLSGAVLPALEEASRTIQGIARAIPQGAVQAVGEAGGGIVANFRRGLAALGLVDENPELKPSFKALPQPQIGTVESFYDRLTTNALGQGPLELEQLQTVNENLRRMIDVLERGAGAGGAAAGSFR